MSSGVTQISTAVAESCAARIAAGELAATRAAFQRGCTTEVDPSLRTLSEKVREAVLESPLGLQAVKELAQRFSRFREESPIFQLVDRIDHRFEQNIAVHQELLGEEIQKGALRGFFQADPAIREIIERFTGDVRQVLEPELSRELASRPLQATLVVLSAVSNVWDKVAKSLVGEDLIRFVSPFAAMQADLYLSTVCAVVGGILPHCR